MYATLSNFLFHFQGSCNSPLGLESGDIRSAQLSASSSYSTDFLPEKARLNGPTGMKCNHTYSLNLDTVNSEIFARFFFARIAIKDLLVRLKFVMRARFTYNRSCSNQLAQLQKQVQV